MGMSATDPVTPAPRRVSIRLRGSLWIGMAAVVLSVVCVAWLLKFPKAQRPFPDAEDVQGIEAKFYDTGKGSEVAFQVPKAHWQPIFSSLLPARRDPDPAKWETLGELRLTLV